MRNEDDEQARPTGPHEARCSRRGCALPARWALRWNNPRLHTPERRKTWLACDEHRAYLTSFLDVRGFLRETVPFEDLED
ncbi:hypothetical protein ACQEU5_24295 [Marinactinospora thermotolerans]|uniref:Acetone carboxylase n=1 Tax=Marinactinospora thermotolerans DSM 45154 TaxID=1122192 RepID=A0A1T4KDQ0_9ACTN|nr:hypothetical protein [Marinactinospora thermotolerans]SJZ40552.1 hypothetical protein SAMN02745673_00326 [Marinactinospora thermotolerans DSM 45154]